MIGTCSPGFCVAVIWTLRGLTVPALNDTALAMVAAAVMDAAGIPPPPETFDGLFRFARVRVAGPLTGAASTTLSPGGVGTRAPILCSVRSQASQTQALSDLTRRFRSVVVRLGHRDLGSGAIL